MPEKVPFEKTKAVLNVFAVDRLLGIERLYVEVNGRAIVGRTPKGQTIKGGKKQIDKPVTVPLRHGENVVRWWRTTRPD